jgi:CRISPR-associated protein Csd2
MMSDAHLNPEVRHDFELLFDVEGGNPNGDPDNANAPRTDPETGHLWVTDVALKRKVRNFVAEEHAGRDGYAIYVEEAVALNSRHREASESLSLKANKKRPRNEQLKAAAVLCQRYYDVRTFGAVMSTGEHPAGQVRGPIQLACPAVSVEPVIASDLTITRVAVTDENELKRLAEGDGGKDREMGAKTIVPYALFRARGSFTPSFAAKTGFSGEDLAVFWDALQRMWALDRSSSRGITGCRGIYVWSHPDRFGRGHAGDLYKRLDVTRIGDVGAAGAAETPARGFEDYKLTVDDTGLPDGITLTIVP